MLASVVLHGLAVLLVPPILDAVAIHSEAKAWKQALHFDRPLRIRLPGPIYAVPLPAADLPVRRLSANARRDLRNPNGIGSRFERTLSLHPSMADLDTRLRFELPKTSEAASPRTLLQPDAPERRLPDLRLPGIFFWAPKLPETLEADAGRVVTPGHAQPNRTLPRFDAPPVLERSTLNAAGQESRDTARQVSGAPRMPVRVLDLGLPPEAAAAAVDPSRGDPAQAFAISPSRVVPGEALELPPFSQLGQTGRQAPSVPAGPQAGSSVPPEEAGAPSALLQRVLAQILSTTRIAHPGNGQFDVVVAASGGSLLPESTFTLSGRPVHAVFLKVGAPRDWILQYCVPASDAPQPSLNRGVLRLGAPTVVQAPYPRLTFRPPARRRAYLTVHGFIEASGRFSRLHLMDATDPDEVWLVLTILQKWEFRPATVSGKPIRVEILLAIAPES